MYWDTTKDATQEFTDITEATGQKDSGESYHVTNGEFVGYWKWKLSTASSLVGANWFEKDGNLYNVGSSVIFATRWDGTGWGDDNQFDVVDGTDAVEDLNGNNVVVGQARVALPYLTGKDD